MSKYVCEAFTHFLKNVFLSHDNILKVAPLTGQVDSITY